MGEKSCLRGVNGWKNLSDGGKIDKKLSDVGKIDGKNCLRGVNKKKKYIQGGVNKSCFVSKRGKENTRFCQGVEQISLVWGGHRDFLSPPPVFLME